MPKINSELYAKWTAEGKDRGEVADLMSRAVAPFMKLSVENGSPSIRLRGSGGFQTVIGTTHLVTKQTCEVHKTSAASVVMFDKDDKVIWEAP